MILFSTGSALFDNLLFMALILLIIVLIWVLIYFFIALKFFKKAFIPPKTFRKGKNSSKWSIYKDKILKNWEELENLEKEELYLTGYKNKKIHATFIKSNTKSNKIVVFSHGWKNSGLNDYACAGMFYHQNGYNVLVVDHYAHGESDGKYISFGYFDSYNIKIWIEHLNHMFNSDCKIYLHGLSMGATIVTKLANCKLENVFGIIADSGYMDGDKLLEYFVKKQVKFMPGVVCFFLRLLCKLVAKVNLKKCHTKSALIASLYPILFLHGDKDDFVPTKNALKSYELCTSKKEIVIFDNAEHIVSCLMHEEKYKKVILEFIEKN